MAEPDRNAAGIPVPPAEDDFISVYDAPSMPEVVQHPSDAPLRPLKVVAEPAPTRPLRAEGKPFPPAPAPAATHTAAPPVAFRSAFAEGPAAPCNEAAIDRNLVALLDPDSFVAEQFKILRTNILYPLVGKPPRSILLTSTGPGEGKTFAAANLAISIALNINRYVLLIDADLRQPQLNVRFGFGAVRPEQLPGRGDRCRHCCCAPGSTS
jgi:hypothetical protein